MLWLHTDYTCVSHSVRDTCTSRGYAILYFPYNTKIENQGKVNFRHLLKYMYYWLIMLVSKTDCTWTEKKIAKLATLSRDYSKMAKVVTVVNFNG